MPTKGFDCCGFAAYTLGDDGKFHPADLSQTVTLTPDITDEEDETNCGLIWEAGDPYHYALVSEQKFTAIMHIRYGERMIMKLLLPKRRFRKWVRTKEKERRRRLKEASGDD